MSSKHRKHHGRNRDRKPQPNLPAPTQPGRAGGVISLAPRRRQSGPVKLFLFGVLIMLVGFVVYAMKNGKESNPVTIAAHASNAPLLTISKPQEPATLPEAKPSAPPPAETTLAAASSVPPLPPASSPPLPVPQPVPQPATAAQPPAPLPVQSPAVQQDGPKIKFATPIHDFGRVKSGEAVIYTYVFTNVGTAPLEIKNVHVSCGCTTAGDWSHLVQPGQTGSIPIQFNSANLSGPVAKSVTVLSNDTNQPMVMLQIKGTVWRPIDVTPQFAVINVNPEMPSNAVTVRIVSNLEEPLTLSEPTSVNPLFTAEVRTNQPGKEYQLVVRTVPGEKMVNAQGQISVKTSSTNMPVINITAWANQQPTLLTIPSQITLPSSPLLNPLASSVSIRNNGTNVLALSEPVVNAENVDVQLRELEPGRFFMATVSFPAGFEMAPTNRVELTIKSNHPRNPVIKVPIYKPQAVPVNALARPVLTPQPTPAPQAGSQSK